MIIQRIEEKEQYEQLINEKMTFSNFYHGSAAIENVLNQNKNHIYSLLSGGFLVIENRETYYKLYFNCSDFEWIEDLELVRVDACMKDIAIEVVANGDDAPYNLDQRLLIKNMKRYTRYRRGGVDPGILDIISEAITYCDLDDVESIEKMLTTTFSPIGDEIPTHNDIEMFV